MKNPRITPKERGLIKGALRRVFSRSDLRREVLEASRIDYKDPTRPRVTKWGVCAECKKPEALYLMNVDHKVPVVPINSSLEEMDLNDLINNIWCEKENLQILDETCHSIKSKAENAERRRLKKERNPNVNKAKRIKRPIKTSRKRAAHRGVSKNCR